MEMTFCAARKMSLGWNMTDSFGRGNVTTTAWCGHPARLGETADGQEAGGTPAPRVKCVIRRRQSAAAPDSFHGGVHSGFTLIELLVVIAIIVIIATTSIMMLSGFLRGSSVKEGGRIVKHAFAKGRQLASTKRAIHYMVFNFDTQAIQIFEDTNRDKAFNNTKDAGGAITGGDVMAGESIPLPQNVYFDKVFGQTTGAPYAAFQPDGGVIFYMNIGSTSQIDDVSWLRPGSSSGYVEGSASAPTASDIALRLGKDTDAPDKVYCDVLPVTGNVRKMEYFHKDGTTALP
jgi:prepilin-type N-terminal cleavage/methylation domain-containing protein